jgi:hypothetical protein
VNGVYQEHILFHQERELFVRFDAFRDQFNVEVARQMRDGADDRQRLGRADQLNRERAIDFYLVYGKPIQIAETAVSRAEVIQRQTQSHCPDLGDFP